MQTPILLPSYDSTTWQPVTGQDVAMMIVTPDAWRKGDGKKWKWMIFVHGMGQRGPGTKEALMNVWTGSMQAFPDDFKQAIDKYGIIAVIVNYNDFLQPSGLEFVISYMEKNYTLADIGMGQGFSWGGGVLHKAMTNSAKVAAKLKVIITVSGTVEVGTGPWSTPAKAGVVFWAHTNDVDETVNPSNSVNAVNSFNASGPITQASLTRYDAKGHGPTNVALSLTPPKAPGGSGNMIDAAENVYELYVRAAAGDLSAPKTGGSGSGPVVVPPVTNPATVTPVVSFKQNGQDVALVGNKSIGYKQGYDGIWSIISAPTGVTGKQVFPNGSSYIDATAKTPVPGTYVFRFTLLGAYYLDVTVVYGSAPAVKVPASFSGNVLTFRDGSKETAVMSWDGSIFQAKTEAGVFYTLQ